MTGKPTMARIDQDYGFNLEGPGKPPQIALRTA